MLPLLGLFFIILSSLTIVRIGASLLELTGLSSDIASFQAISAFFGIGYTTSEAESVVNSPLRRKIITILMIIGNLGITTSVATLILTFLDNDKVVLIEKIGLLLLGLILMFFLARSKIFHSILKKITANFMNKTYQTFLCDYEEILGVSRGFIISKIYVKDRSWMAGKNLQELKLDKEGTLVLSISRIPSKKSSLFIGVPKADTIIAPDDILTCYGRAEACHCLATRLKGLDGDKEHLIQIEKEKEFEKQQKFEMT